MMQQIIALIRQNCFFSVVSIIGTAVSITFVMVIYASHGYFLCISAQKEINLFGTEERVVRHRGEK